MAAVHLGARDRGVSAGKAGAGPADERPGTITTVHTYDLPLARQEVWALISDVANYRQWWPWLRVFEALSLAEGEEWRCQVQPPVPYPVRFQVGIEEVRPSSLVRALVRGDVLGEATLTLDDAAAFAGTGAVAGSTSGTVVTLSSALAPGNAALRLVSRFAPPVARFGHDWVLDSGVRQFVARATRDRGVDGGDADKGSGRGGAGRDADNGPAPA